MFSGFACIISAMGVRGKAILEHFPLFPGVRRRTLGERHPYQQLIGHVRSPAVEVQHFGTFSDWPWAGPASSEYNEQKCWISVAGDCAYHMGSFFDNSFDTCAAIGQSGFHPLSIHLFDQVSCAVCRGDRALPRAKRCYRKDVVWRRTAVKLQDRMNDVENRLTLLNTDNIQGVLNDFI